jgi:hypothetical protein
LDEFGDIFTYKRHTLAVRIGAYGTNLLLEFFRTIDDIGREDIGCQVAERWPFHEGNDLDGLKKKFKVQCRSHTCLVNEMGG